MAHVENPLEQPNGNTTPAKNKTQKSSITHHAPELSLVLDHIRPALCQATVIVPSAIVDALYHESAVSQQHSAQTAGFNRGEVPLTYVKQNFKEHLIEHSKEFLFKLF